jgi:GNAT superfamily N-acetyltransferase
MITLRDLALLEEGRLVRAISDVAPESRLLSPEDGGGLLARGEPGTWPNVGVGLGLAGPVPERVIDELIEWHTAVGAEPRVELIPFADPSLVRALAARGFVVGLFENVFFRELSPSDEFPTPHILPDAISIETINPADERAVHECACVVATAFAGDRDPLPASVELAKACIRHPRSVTLAARCDSRVVGAGSVEMLGATSALFGLSVRADFRRRGVQQALIAARLRIAASRGARIVTISARPGVATEGNARRMGFQVAYTKPVVVRPGNGLAPVVD